MNGPMTKRRGSYVWRSVRSKILLMTAFVVFSSVILTAVMVSVAVQNAVREEAARSLTNDAAIYQELLDYGTTHTTWDDADSKVRDLAERYDRRVALKSEQGRLLVDSDLLLDQDSGSLRAKPEVVIDPFDPRIDVFQTPFTTGGILVAPQATEEDRSDNADRVASASACLDQLGVQYDILDTETGLEDVSVRGQLTDPQWELASQCLEELRLPRPSELERIRTENEAMLACLRDRGVDPQIQAGDYGDEIILDPADTEAQSVYDTCLDQTARARVAPPVELYLGSANSTGLNFGGAATASTVLIVLGIVVIAGTAAVVLSGRIVRPLQSLASAVYRLGDGDLLARVPVKDRSEIGALASTFNAMAESLARSENSRRQMVADIAHELRNPLVTLRAVSKRFRTVSMSRRPSCSSLWGKKRRIFNESSQTYRNLQTRTPALCV